MKNKERNYWVESASDFSQERIDSRQYILLSEIANIITREKVSRVLDFGCGEGHLNFHLNNKSIEVCLYDNSPMMTDIAKTNLEQYGCNNVKILSTVEQIPDNYFDISVLSLVLLTIKEESEVEAVLNIIAKKLNNNGSLIVGTTHPCFRQQLFSTHHTEYSLKHSYNYFKNNEPFTVYLRTNVAQKLISFQDYHHNLEYMFKKLKAAGFYVDEIVELKDRTIENSFYNKFFPPYIILKCNKR